MPLNKSILQIDCQGINDLNQLIKISDFNQVVFIKYTDFIYKFFRTFKNI